VFRIIPGERRVQNGMSVGVGIKVPTSSCGLSFLSFRASSKVEKEMSETLPALKTS
jgi:hypothetical protein